MINNSKGSRLAIKEQVNQFINFYNSLSFSVMGFIPLGTRGVLNFDTYTYEAMKGTLESILILVENRRVNDAYSLLRKFFDISLINVYVNLYLKKEFSVDQFVVTKIQNWLSGEEKIPEYREIRVYISKSELKVIQKELSKLPYDKIRQRCNDHVHYNLFKHVLMNTHVYDEKEDEILKQLLTDIRQVISLHLSYIFYLNPHYMACSDIIDYMEMGMALPEGYENEVAPYIQDIFESLIDIEAPSIKEIIKKNCSMKLL